MSKQTPGPEAQLAQAGFLIAQEFSAAGFVQPSAMPVAALPRLLLHAALPDQVPPAQPEAAGGTEVISYFNNEVASALADPDDVKRPTITRLAQHLGRFVAASQQQGSQSRPPELTVGNRELIVDGEGIAIDLTGTFVVELGMGLSGLRTHITALKDKRYRVVNIQPNPLEAAIITGYTGFHGIPASQVSNRIGSLTEGVESMLSGSRSAKAGAIIASRVEVAGQDLLQAMSLASSLIKTDGILVARGPRRAAPPAVGYEKVRFAMRTDDRLAMEVDVTQTRTLPFRPGRPQIEEHVVAVGRKQPA